jgi:hypothetical protein
MSDLSQPPETVGGATNALVRGDVNQDAMRMLGVRLSSLFTTYENDRRLSELKWLQNARQYLGVLDPQVEAKLDPNRSRAYPKLTRVKVMSMVARLMNLLFPTSEKNWTVEPSPVPNLAPDDLQNVLNTLADAQGNEISDELIEEAIQKFAKARADNLSKEIQDQLDELGGDRAYDYVALCKRVIISGVSYGCGVLKGPFVRTQTQRTWKRGEGNTFVFDTIEANRPQFEHVSIWDYYPDLSAKTFAQMDGQFERHVMSRHQVRKLADRQDFFGDVIKHYLATHVTGNYKRRMHEMELKSMGVQNLVQDQDGRKFELLQWTGWVSGHEMQGAGITVKPGMLSEEVEADVWLLDGTVIKCDLNPWAELESGYKVNTYHQFVFEYDETSLLGNALPAIMRDSQMGVTAATMLLMDNAGIACTPSVEINTDLVRMDQDTQSIHGYQVWYREGMGPDAQYPAVRSIEYNAYIEELLKLIEKFENFADQETFVNAQTGGDMQDGPSEPFRTAAGASMLRGDAALPFKDVVRNFDVFTESVLTSLVAFNEQFNTKASIKGDFQIIARGATSLIAKEVRGMAIDTLVQTTTPEDAPYFNRFDLLKERVAVRDLPRSVLVSDEEAVRIKKATEDAASANAAQQGELIRAEVRKLLGDALKAVTQADKNTAAAAAESANLVLGALEHDLDSRTATSDALLEAAKIKQAGAGGTGGAGGAKKPA